MSKIYIRQKTDLSKVSGVFHLSQSDFNTFFFTHGIQPHLIKKGHVFTDENNNQFFWHGNNGLNERVLWINDKDAISHLSHVP